MRTESEIRAEMEKLEEQVCPMSENGEIAKKARLNALRWVVEGYE